MSETVFDELKRYVRFGEAEERAALVGGESRVGHLKVTLQAWLDTLRRGPWDHAYWEHRTNIGRVHVRIGLPQHYMFGAMNVVRIELAADAYDGFHADPL